MSEERSSYRVIQNGNPFADGARILAPREVLTVIDGGANVGDVAWHMRANFPAATIHAFEPDPDSFTQLSDRFLDDVRLVPVCAGLSEQTGTATLYRYEESGLNALAPLQGDAGTHLEGYGVAPVGSTEIELTSIDAYCADLGIDFIDFLKLDLQGWEIPALRGAAEMASTGRIGVIYTEVNFVDLYADQDRYEHVAAVLDELGFRLFNLYAMSFNRKGQLGWADALFAHERLDLGDIADAPDPEQPDPMTTMAASVERLAAETALGFELMAERLRALEAPSSG